MKISDNIPVYSSSDLFNLIYQGHADQIFNLFVDIDDEISQFQNFANKTFPNLEVAKSNKENQKSWFIPEEYKSLDIEQWVIEQAPPWDPEHARVVEELEEYKKRDMLDLLRWLKFFVDTCRKNNVLWGVGRGSSVASYVLYLIGVHKIDSIKYNLDFNEFMR